MALQATELRTVLVEHGIAEGAAYRIVALAEQSIADERERINGEFAIRDERFDRIAEQLGQLARAVARQHEDGAELRARGLQQAQAVGARRGQRELVRLHRPRLPGLRFHAADERAAAMLHAALREDLFVDIKHRLGVAREDALRDPARQLRRHRGVAVGAGFAQFEAHGVPRRAFGEARALVLPDHVEGRRQQAVERPRALRVAQPADGHEAGHQRSSGGRAPAPCRIGPPS